MISHNDIKLIALDLDGTLLHDNKAMSQYTLDTLTKLSKQNIEIVPASGRNLMGLRDNILRLPFIHYAICSNGANIFNLTDNTLLHEIYMSSQDAITVIHYLQQFPTVIYSHTDAGIFRSDNWTADLSIKYPYVRFSDNNVPDLAEHLRKHPCKVYKVGVFIRTTEAFQAITSNPPPCSNVILQCTGDGLLEFNSVNAGKGAALEFLCNSLSIPLSQTLAIGDNENDISMLQIAGISAAMANSAPHIRFAARYLAGNNNDDGAAAFLHNYFELS